MCIFPTHAFEKILCMFLQSCFIYWAYVPLSHCQENWILERFHCFTPLKFSFLPFFNSESSAAFLWKSLDYCSWKGLGADSVMCSGELNSLYPVGCIGGFSLFHRIQKLTYLVQWWTLSIPWNTEAHLLCALGTLFIPWNTEANLLCVMVDSLYSVEYRNSPTVYIGGSLYF